MSTCWTGRTTSSILPLMSVMAAANAPVSAHARGNRSTNHSLSLKPLASMIFCAWSMMFDMSI